MIKAAIKLKLFIKVWLWTLLIGTAAGTGLSVLIGWLTGVFKSPPAGGDDMAQGLFFVFMLLGLVNLIGYIVALVVGLRYVKRSGQLSKLFLLKAVPLCILSAGASILFAPLLLFGSLLAAFAVTFSIRNSA